MIHRIVARLFGCPCRKEALDWEVKVKDWNAGLNFDARYTGEMVQGMIELIVRAE